MNVADKAKEFAIAQHATQKYGEHPYSYHLAQVSQVLAEFGYAGDEAIAAAGWLHDILEDTPTTYEMLVSEFGEETADIVVTAHRNCVAVSPMVTGELARKQA